MNSKDLFFCEIWMVERRRALLGIENSSRRTKKKARKIIRKTLASDARRTSVYQACRRHPSWASITHGMGYKWVKRRVSEAYGSPEEYCHPTTHGGRLLNTIERWWLMYWGDKFPTPLQSGVIVAEGIGLYCILPDNSFFYWSSKGEWVFSFRDDNFDFEHLKSKATKMRLGCRNFVGLPQVQHLGGVMNRLEFQKMVDYDQIRDWKELRSA